MIKRIIESIVYGGSYELEYAYDEDGDNALCSCGEEMYYDGRNYICTSCGNKETREEFFSTIGAEEYMSRCLVCGNNYPACRDYCDDYDEYES